MLVDATWRRNAQLEDLTVMEVLAPPHIRERTSEVEYSKRRALREIGCRFEFRFARSGKGQAQRWTIDFMFPARHYQRGDAVAEHVNRRAEHAHEPVDP